MPSSNYTTIRSAMAAKQQVICTYNGYHRELCVHTLGTSGNKEMALAYQFAGDSSNPPRTDADRWRCLEVEKIEKLAVRDGEWYSADNHSKKQTCVKEVDLEVYP